MRGTVYVVEFDNDVVKVGRTKNIAKRLHEHIADAKRYGIEVGDWWYEDVDDMVTAEAVLIESALRWSSKRLAREYFADTYLDPIVRDFEMHQLIPDAG